MIPGSSLFSRNDPDVYPGKIVKEVGHTDNDSLKIEKLFDLAFFYDDYLGNDLLSDSVSRIAIRIAEASHRPELRRIAYNRFIESANFRNDYKKALGYALEAERISDPRNAAVAFRNTRNLVTVYLYGYDYDKALEYAYKALSIANSADNPAWRSESYLDIGRSFEGKNQKIEAFRNYLDAMAIAERMQDDRLKMKCYSRLSAFYNLIRIQNKATHFKLLEADLLRKAKPVDSVALMWTRYDLQSIDLNSNNNLLDEGSIREILDFAKRWKHERMLKFEFALIRSHYIEADKIRQLHELYTKQFPRELASLQFQNTGLYFRLKAYFSEEEGRPDSAYYYFNKAETIISNDPNKILQSKFYNRFGQFLLRQGQKDKAIGKFTKSYALAGEASYLDYMLSTTRQLESLYAGKGDFKNAFRFSVLNKTLSDSLSNLSKQDQMLVMEIDYETHQRDLAAQAGKEATARRHYLQYSAMIIVIISVFIILLMLGSLKVPEWIIKMLGFFSFIMLFEFIVLIADHKIQDITGGEPWKILLIKIILIGFLLPFHHWIEKRVVTFLLGPGMINIANNPLLHRMKKRAPVGAGQ
jgi:tetratricopeptide (TPR) repeat protein